MKNNINRIAEMSRHIEDGIFMFYPGYTIAKNGDIVGIRVDLSDLPEKVQNVFVFDVNIPEKKILNNFIAIDEKTKNISEESSKLLKDFFEKYDEAMKIGDGLADVRVFLK